MGDVVNLNQFRKRREREERAKNATENRVKFGRNKRDRALLQLESKRERTELDNKLLQDKSASRDESDAERPTPDKE